MIKPEICTKRFASKVLDAIFNDGVEEELFNENYRTRYVRRLNRWFGKSGAKRLLIKRCEILDCWKNSDSGFVPDAFLIDPENKTIVCYEVEDHHPLNPFSVGRYSNAWWTLEYIYWDLHLIAYDIYGNARVIAFPSSDFLSREVRDRRNPPIAWLPTSAQAMSGRRPPNQVQQRYPIRGANACRSNTAALNVTI